MLPKTFEELPLNKENLLKALLPFSTAACGDFLCNLRDGFFDSRIEELD
jgi:hypothetical protein